MEWVWLLLAMAHPQDDNPVVREPIAQHVGPYRG